jgi:hypothetical protein
VASRFDQGWHGEPWGPPCRVTNSGVIVQLARLVKLGFGRPSPTIFLSHSPLLSFPSSPRACASSTPPSPHHRLDAGAPTPVGRLLRTPTPCRRPFFSFPSSAESAGGNRRRRRLYKEEWRPRRRFPALRQRRALVDLWSLVDVQVKLLPLLPIDFLLSCLIGFMSRVRKLGKLWMFLAFVHTMRCVQ